MRNILFSAVALLLLASCAHDQKSFERYLATADSTQLSSDITDLHSPSRKILHSADITCRVPDVMNAVTQTEYTVKSLGGIVVTSKMYNNDISFSDVPYTVDSLKRTQVYTPVASMVLKVPVSYMDSVINLLSANASVVNNRSVTQQDMTLTYLSNALRNQRAESNIKPVKYTPPANTASEILAEEVKAKNVQDEQIVNRKIDNLRILEETEYVTLFVNFSQPEQVDIYIVANTQHLMRPPLGTRMILALGTGADAFCRIILFTVQLWPLWFIAVPLWLMYRHKRGLSRGRQL